MLQEILKKRISSIVALIELFQSNWKRDGFKKYLSNTLWMFGSRFFLMTTGFFVSVWMARHLGVANFGLFNYIIGLVGILSFFSNLGIDAILGRELLNNPERKPFILGNAIILYAIAGIATLVVTNLIAYFLDPDAYTQQLIFILSLTYLFQPVSALVIFFQSHVQAKKIAIISILTSTLSIGLKILGILSGYFVMWFVGVVLLEVIVSTLLFTYFAKKANVYIIFNFDSHLSWTILQHAFPFMISIAATSIYMKIDQVMLKHMLGTTETGVYSVAVRLTEVWYFIPNIIVASLTPAIINARLGNISIYNSRIKYLLILLFFIACVLTIALALSAEKIVSFLYGVEFQDAISPLLIYVWSTIPVFLMPALTAYFTAEHKGYTLLVVSVFSTFLNIAMNIVLIPKIGITGAAIATVISYSIPTVYLLFVMIRTIKKQKYA